MALKTESFMFSEAELVELNFGILGLLHLFEKKLFKVSAVSESKVSVFSFSVRFIFSLNTVCQRVKVILYSETYYYSYHSSNPNFCNTCFWSFSREKRIYLFPLHKAGSCLLFSFLKTCSSALICLLFHLENLPPKALGVLSVF